MKSRSADDFYGSETTLYYVIMMNTFYYTFVKILRLYNIKSEL